MHRRDLLKAGLGAGMLGLAGPAALRAAAADKKADRADKSGPRPNIIFLLIDDMGWRDVGCFGSTYYLTPNIDRLAREGMKFTDAYTCGPNCAPTRACLMSGQYTPRHGVFTVGNADRGSAKLRRLIPIKNKTQLAAEVVTLGETLHAAGYTTASMGKWHLGDGPTGPRGQGFDVNVGGNQAGHPRSYFSPYKNKDLPDGPKGEYLTDRLTDEALKFIENCARPTSPAAAKAAARDVAPKPFFLYLPHYAVHTPIQAKKDLTATYAARTPSGGQKNPKYAAMIDSTDQGIGRILNKLDELKIADNTVVIFSSDNGGVAGITSMAPLRGAKGMLYEGGVRVPTIVRWPGKVRAGSTCDTPVITVDFYPTLAELAGATLPDQPLDGRSIAGLLRGKALPERPIYWHFPAYLQGRGGRNPTWRTTPAGAVRLGEWKLLEFFEDGGLELYNLAKDIGEKTNLADKHADKRDELHKLLKAWRKAINAPVPTEKNPAYAPAATAATGKKRWRGKRGK